MDNLKVQTNKHVLSGDVKTYHMGELGLTVKIIPKYDSIKKKHYVGCWKKTTGDKRKIKALTILPSDWYWPFRGTQKKFEVMLTIFSAVFYTF